MKVVLTSYVNKHDFTILIATVLAALVQALVTNIYIATFGAIVYVALSIALLYRAYKANNAISLLYVFTTFCGLADVVIALGIIIVNYTL